MEAEEPAGNALIDPSFDEEDGSSVSSLDPHKDNSRTPCEELKGTELEWSTVRNKNKFDRKAKECSFCGLHYAGGPAHIRLRLLRKAKHIRKCEPTVNWVQRHGEVTSALLKREDDVLRVINAEAKKKKRRLSEDVASFNLPAGPLQVMKPTRDMVTEQ